MNFVGKWAFYALIAFLLALICVNLFYIVAWFQT